MNDIMVSEIISRVNALVFGVVIIFCISWIVVTAVNALKQRANTRTRADIYNRLIDKFAAAPEFIAFLQSDAGLKFIEENTGQTIVPLGKILTSTQVGIILALLGAGLLVTGNIFGESLGGDLYIALTVGGVGGLTIGIGLLVSVLVSYRLCQAWGILPKNDGKETS